MAKTYKRKTEIGSGTKPVRKKVSENKIRERAYEIYLRRKGKDGSEQSDWLIAEDELMFGSDF